MPKIGHSSLSRDRPANSARGSPATIKMAPHKSVDQELAGRRRYRLAAYTTAANIVSKSLSLVVLYVSVPLTIHYLGTERFGIWMTLASLIGFLGFLDFGIGSSLLNQVAYSAAKEPRERLRRLITHGLLLLTGLGIVLMAFLLCAARFSRLEGLFNVSNNVDPNELRTAAYTLAILIGLSLPIVGLQRVLWGLQRAFVYHFLVAAGSLASLVLLFVLAKHHAHIYALLLATYGLQLVATVPLLGFLYREGLIGALDWEEFVRDAKELLGHGVLFFILSIGGAVAWDSDYIIISNVVGAGAVAVYAVAVRMFQLVELPLQMANAPLWSAYADAMAHGSHGFLRKTLGKAVLLTVVAALLGAGILVAFHGFIIHVWIRQAVILPLYLTYSMALWIVIRSGGNAFAMYLNGVRVVIPQVVVVIVFCIFALPLKIYGAHQLGALGVVLASTGAYLVCVMFPYLTVFRRAWSSPLKGA